MLRDTEGIDDLLQSAAKLLSQVTPAPSGPGEDKDGIKICLKAIGTILLVQARETHNLRLAQEAANDIARDMLKLH